MGKIKQFAMMPLEQRYELARYGAERLDLEGKVRPNKGAWLVRRAWLVARHGSARPHPIRSDQP